MLLREFINNNTVFIWLFFNSVWKRLKDAYLPTYAFFVPEKITSKIYNKKMAMYIGKFKSNELLFINYSSGKKAKVGKY